jgi:hypothetical protein
VIQVAQTPSVFIGTHNETPPVAAMRVSNPDRAPVGIKKDRTVGNRTTVRLSNGYSLLNLCERATAWGLRPGSFFLVQQRAKPVAVVAAAAAAFRVFVWLQVRLFDFFLRFFLCHFILLSRWFGLP